MIKIPILLGLRKIIYFQHLIADNVVSPDLHIKDLTVILFSPIGKKILPISCEKSALSIYMMYTSDVLDLWVPALAGVCDKIPSKTHSLISSWYLFKEPSGIQDGHA